MSSALRIKWPTKRVLIGNTDVDAAYCRIHANTTTTLTCIEIVGELAFLCLSFPFGTTPMPAEYMTASKAAIYIGNDVLMNPETHMA